MNLGMNIGKAAGAGVAGHIHMHVLPRWVADANFVSVVGETRILPESSGRYLRADQELRSNHRCHPERELKGKNLAQDERRERKSAQSQVRKYRAAMLPMRLCASPRSCAEGECQELLPLASRKHWPPRDPQETQHRRSVVTSSVEIRSRRMWGCHKNVNTL